LKLKTLAVITILVLGCSAAFAQGSATLGFTDYTDSILYCNYEIFSWGGNANFYMQGQDNLANCTTATGVPAATVEGVAVSVPKAAGAPVSGLAYAGADGLIDAIYGTYTGEQWFVITKTKPSIYLKVYGWVGYLGYNGYELFGNYGYLSASIPGGGGNKPVSKNSVISGLKGAALKTRAKMVQ
jgi:hypothetical protein